MAKDLFVGLEIGTSRTIASVGEMDEVTGRIKMVGVGVYPTTGVRKGLIVDMGNVKLCVDGALHAAAKKTETDLWELVVACSGGHIQAKSESGILPIRSPDRLVSEEDVREVAEIARGFEIPSDRICLHTITQSYQVDEQCGILRPVEMRCNELRLFLLAITGKRNQIENIRHVVQELDMDVKDVVFSGICAAMAVLSSEQKKSGVVLIDLGGGTTNYIAFVHQAIAAAGSLGVGGDHVTNDIASAFEISGNAAEELKRKSGSAVLETSGTPARVMVKTDVGFEDKSVSVRALQTVINARMDELFRIIRSRLDEAGVLLSLSSGIVLTGGGAYLKGVVELAQRVFGVPCSIGSILNVDGVNEDQPASMATAAGLLLYASKSQSAVKETGGVFSLIKNFFIR